MDKSEYFTLLPLAPAHQNGLQPASRMLWRIIVERKDHMEIKIYKNAMACYIAINSILHEQYQFPAANIRTT